MARQRPLLRTTALAAGLTITMALPLAVVFPIPASASPATPVAVEAADLPPLPQAAPDGSDDLVMGVVGPGESPAVAEPDQPSSEELALQARNAERVRELTGQRTARSTSWLLDNGMTETKSYARPVNYLAPDGRWRRIGFRPVATPTVGDSGSFSAPTYRATDGPIETSFSGLREGTGGPEFRSSTGSLRLVPMTRRSVTPRLVAVPPTQHVRYDEVWPDVDLSYEYRGVSVETYVTLRSARQHAFRFRVAGGRARMDGRDVRFSGAGGALVLQAPSIALTGRGPVRAPIGYRVLDEGRTLELRVGRSWLSSLPSSAFPAVIDPELVDRSTIPGGDTGLFWAYKSDGFTCASSRCNVNIGTLNDRGWKHWRTMIRLPYEHVYDRQIVYAQVDMAITNAAGWEGYHDDRTVWATWANCFGFDCRNGAPHVTGTIGTSGSINVTAVIEWLERNRGANGGWMMFFGDEGQLSYKQIHPSSVALTTYTNWRPSNPSPQAPNTSTGSTVVIPTTTPQLAINPSVDPDGDALTYQFTVTTLSGVTVFQTDYNASRQWILPEGILQDDVSYHWNVSVADDTYSSPAIRMGTIKPDLRTGKDKTQTYDQVGPVDVSLNTGNVYSGVGTHDLKALGGTIGLALEYNTPMLARPGLIAEFYPNTTFSGPVRARRIEPNINSNYDLGSPVPNVIPNDEFSVVWSGYFVAENAGDYYFGGENDDPMTVTVNGTQVFRQDCCSPGWSTTPVRLGAGEAVPLRVTLVEQRGASRALLRVRGAVSEQVVPTSMLRTRPLPTKDNTGLTGHYYAYEGSAAPDMSTLRAPFMVRRDPTIRFDYGEQSPAPGAPADRFAVRWEGYFTAPIAATYRFGAASDDGVRLSINDMLVVDRWVGRGFPASPDWATRDFTLAAGQTVPIRMEYYEGGGPGRVELLMQTLDGSIAPSVVDASYLRPGTSPLPAGWELSVDADGDLAYERLSVRQNGDIIAYDSDSFEHRFTSTGTGFRPPTNEDAVLTRAGDGTYQITDTDGRIYVFSALGELTSTSVPTDSRRPSALRFSYAQRGGVPTLVSIADGVAPERAGTLAYVGDPQCAGKPSQPSIPAGFDAAPPSGYLCAFLTSDGSRTDFYYVNGRLARLVAPGGEAYDMSYSVDGVLTSIRDVLAADAIAAGVRSATDSGTATQLAYDSLGRTTAITGVAATPGARRVTDQFTYLPSRTLRRISDSYEPSGFSQAVTFDNLFRTTADCDALNLCTTQVWDPEKDLLFSTTDALGTRTTTLYNANDLPVDSFGPAPAAWFGNDRAPLPERVDQVPHTRTGYDEGIVGPAVSWHDYRRTPGSSAGVLFGGGRLYTTGIGNAARGRLDRGDVTTPITPSPDAQGIGFRATGKLTLEPGTYSVRATAPDGVRVYIDDVAVVDAWSDSGSRTTTGSTFTVAAGQPLKRFRAEAYWRNGASGAFALELMKQGGFTWTSDWTPFLKPDYNLVTSTTAYDARTGNSRTVTDFGSTPELGLARSVTEDADGLALTTQFRYEEAGGSGFLRQIGKTLPGGSRYTYVHYGPEERVANPCDPTSPAVSQAGFVKSRVEPDPDGDGPSTSRVQQLVYDAAGDLIATRFNDDPWTCTFYDARGRPTRVIQPPVAGRPGRTVTNDYALNGNPLVTSSTDESGTITVETDLRGRNLRYTDAHGQVTSSAYNARGNLVQRTGPLGTETFTYDRFERLTAVILDGEVLAEPEYDDYSRMVAVRYPSAGQLRLTLERDTLRRLSQLRYTLGDGSAGPYDRVTRSPGGDVVTGQENGLDKTYRYDGAGRLLEATLGDHNFRYGYGPTSSAICSAPEANLVAGRSGNRTSATLDGERSSFCYDQADRLIASTDPTLTNPLYDDHGNTVRLGTGSATTEFSYDALDRNIGITQGGRSILYGRDIQGRIIRRTVTDGSTSTTHRYVFTGSGDSPDLVMDESGDVVERYLQLPGDVILTIRGGRDRVYGLPNIHGDVMATVDATGALSGTFMTGPFGERLPAPQPVDKQATVPNGTLAGSSWNYVGQHQKLAESDLTLGPIQMGARVYLPGLGRFLQVDPVEGGTPSSYAYPVDPVNDFDLSGTWSFKQIAKGVASAASIAAFIPGPVGMVASGVAAASYAAAGDWKGALTATLGIIPFAKVGGLALKAIAKKAPSIGSAIRKISVPRIQGSLSAGAKYRTANPRWGVVASIGTRYVGVRVILGGPGRLVLRNHRSITSRDKTGTYLFNQGMGFIGGKVIDFIAERWNRRGRR